MKFNALMESRQDFIYRSQFKEKHQEKVRRSFDSWRGLQSKGSNPTMEQFMEGYTAVIVTVERQP